ncbi:MAG: hypothetical protein LBI57_00920 [Helicobacteraceae bacterium]|jgi:hypothetical protein|nr:hypothetical protein [Helicobacteraceae bacterium]
MDINEFKANSGLMELPAELENLIHFQNNQSDNEEYSDGFGIRIDKKHGLKTWSKNIDINIENSIKYKNNG